MTKLLIGVSPRVILVEFKEIVEAIIICLLGSCFAKADLRKRNSTVAKPDQHSFAWSKTVAGVSFISEQGGQHF